MFEGVLKQIRLPKLLFLIPESFELSTRHTESAFNRTCDKHWLIHGEWYMRTFLQHYLRDPNLYEPDTRSRARMLSVRKAVSAVLGTGSHLDSCQIMDPSRDFLSN